MKENGNKGRKKIAHSKFIIHNEKKPVVQTGFFFHDMHPAVSR
ncbi:MAG TPA: hypothetical protein DEB17_08140 [Chlorobaculum sp.]|uniref:Uncharacterized protein n=1 Tax=Chlorobaculum tepidum (strain ATCC 49652 / DSM 12025 / NBRC 103806 / TLS) TaxID=194439 RepID=Q8KD68_CHLTE|nr:hypothetical protein CT1186 [Chlorobaculum tepidum TLS]HBU23941.1 hypothetical protein [Chlorobaculum sp.]